MLLWTSGGCKEGEECRWAASDFVYRLRQSDGQSATSENKAFVVDKPRSTNVKDAYWKRLLRCRSVSATPGAWHSPDPTVELVTRRCAVEMSMFNGDGTGDASVYKDDRTMNSRKRVFLGAMPFTYMIHHGCFRESNNLPPSMTGHTRVAAENVAWKKNNRTSCSQWITVRKSS